jgi:GNAT superfamily N-acetyltransferase
MSITYKIITDVKPFQDEVNRLIPQVFEEKAFDVHKIHSKEEQEKIKLLGDNFKNRLKLHIGAYDGDKLVGWNISSQRSSDTLHTIFSGVLPEYRKQGIYTEMTKMVLEEAPKLGFQIVTSTHQIVNSPVIISKLKLGFLIEGMLMTEELGPMITLKYFVSPLREKVYKYRTGKIPVGHPDYNEVVELLTRFDCREL